MYNINQMSFISRLGTSAKSIGEFAKRHARSVKSAVENFVYEHNPDPSFYVVDTLNEMIDLVKHSKDRTGIYDHALRVLNSIFSCFNTFYYTHIQADFRSMQDPENKGRLTPKRLGEWLIELSELSDNEPYHRLVQILLKDAQFQTFCKNIEPHQYDQHGQHYIDHSKRYFKVALLMHGGNIASFMNALSVGIPPVGYYEKYKRTIKCWLSAFFSAETARVFNKFADQNPKTVDRTKLQLSPDKFSGYPERIAALAFFRPIPDVVPQRYADVVKSIQEFCRTVRTEVATCEICLEKFKNTTTVNGSDIGIQCPDETCHENHPFCQGCAKKWLDEGKTSCPSCRRPLKRNENHIPEFLRQLHGMNQKLDEASTAYAEFPYSACGDGLSEFMLAACADFKRRSDIIPEIKKIKQQVDKLLEQLIEIQDGMKGRSRSRSRSRSPSPSPSRGGARKRTTRISRKQRKQRKQCKSRKQRK
jgi:hypothetical protein